MNVFKVIFNVPYGKHICVVAAINGDKALQLALNELHANNITDYNDKDIESVVARLPLLSRNDIEKVIFIESYEE